MAVRKKFNNRGHMRDDALGRGLDALISTDEVSTQGSSTINEIDINEIEPNPGQPRRDFDEESLSELAVSIKEIGIIQPITLRQTESGKYQIIAGERRWRASQIAGLKTIPAYIKTVNDENVMELALVENIQREDLNAIEIALAYEHLMETTGMTQERMSERVGKSRSSIANYLRLLRLPAQVQIAMQKQEIDMGHARALLSVESPSLQIKLFREIKKHGYSVRKVEEMVRRLQNEADVDHPARSTASDKLPEKLNDMRSRLSDVFSTKVQMTCSAKGKGKISIPFDNEEQLAKIMSMLDKIKG